ncbi:MAG: hypothetical protein HY257_07025 [Chloroflexi bacterium]|nr:hypothetical protein [Chloroflexota bacterium]
MKQKSATATQLLMESNGASAARLPFDEEIVDHLSRAYGANATRVAEIARANSGASRLIAALPYVWAEVDYALENEMVVTLADFLARRTHILNEDRDHGIEIAPQVAARLAQKLNWDATRVQQELRAYQDQIELAK